MVASTAKSRIAERRKQFRLGIEPLVAGLGLPTGGFAPRGRVPSGMAFFADAETLVVATSEAEEDAVIDDVLAYGLSHADTQDRELVMILPSRRTRPTVMRSSLLSRPLRIFAFTDDTAEPVVIPEGLAVLDAGDLHEPSLRGGELDLGNLRARWVQDLEKWADSHPDLVSAHRGSYRSWHCDGRQLLKLQAKRGSAVHVTAGVNSPSTPMYALVEVTLTDALEPPAFAGIRAAVEHGVADRLQQKDDSHKEHRLQASLRRHYRELEWPTPPLREFPALRPGGSTGYIDFLRLDADSVLHVIETKIGDDAFLVLQGLDYWLWAHANAQELARHFGVEAFRAIVIDYLVGEPGGQVPNPLVPVLSGYAPAQLRALGDRVTWEVFRVGSWASAGQPSLQALGQMAIPGKPHVRH